MSRKEAIYIRALTETDGPFSLGLEYVAVHITPEWQQAHYFEGLHGVVQFIYETFGDGSEGGGKHGKTAAK